MFFFSSRRRHTRCALVTGVQTCALPVTAPAAGTVAYARAFRDYGPIVIIDHRGGWTTLVTGIGTLAVRPGDSVAQGATIGRVGTAHAGATPRTTIGRAQCRARGCQYVSIWVADGSEQKQKMHT